MGIGVTAGAVGVGATGVVAMAGIPPGTITAPAGAMASTTAVGRVDCVVTPGDEAGAHAASKGAISAIAAIKTIARPYRNSFTAILLYGNGGSAGV
jgi:hypothetical protein